MEGKYTLYALAVRDSAHGECFVESAALTANDYTGENLNSFLVPFHHAGVNTHAIPNRERRSVTPLLFFLDSIDDLIHENPLSPARQTGE